MSNYTGSIDLTKVPKRFFKKVICKDGTEHVFLNVGLWERKTPSTFGERTYTHSMKVSVPKYQKVEGENYYIGDFSELKPMPSQPTTEQIEAAPSASSDDLPF